MRSITSPIFEEGGKPLKKGKTRKRASPIFEEGGKPLKKGKTRKRASPIFEEGGKPFDTTQAWFADLLKQIGQA